MSSLFLATKPQVMKSASQLLMLPPPKKKKKHQKKNQMASCTVKLPVSLFLYANSYFCTTQSELD